MDSRGKIGKMGEDAVCKYLIAKGHSILERNWRSGHREIDIISLAGDGIHFVEVKSLTAPARFRPEQKVGLAKQKLVASAAQSYLHKKDNSFLWGKEAWLDVAAVIFDKGQTRISYFPAAYTAIYF